MAGEKYTMSKYANYTVASDDYDKTRAAVGVDTILACLARTAVRLGDQTVLETGCGTGNYLEALRPHLACLAGIDFSEGMLAQARTKLSEDVELTCGSILDMPYEDERFDGITCNQVIHHLEEGPDAPDDPADWGAASFSECDTVLSRGISSLAPGRRVRHQRNIARPVP